MSRGSVNYERLYKAGMSARNRHDCFFDMYLVSRCSPDRAHYLRPARRSVVLAVFTVCSFMAFAATLLTMLFPSAAGRDVLTAASAAELVSVLSAAAGTCVFFFALLLFFKLKMRMR